MQFSQIAGQGRLQRLWIQPSSLTLEQSLKDSGGSHAHLPPQDRSMAMIQGFGGESKWVDPDEYLLSRHILGENLKKLGVNREELFPWVQKMYL